MHLIQSDFIILYIFELNIISKTHCSSTTLEMLRCACEVYHDQYFNDLYSADLCSLAILLSKIDRYLRG